MTVPPELEPLLDDNSRRPSKHITDRKPWVPNGNESGRSVSTGYGSILPDDDNNCISAGDLATISAKEDDGGDGGGEGDWELRPPPAPSLVYAWTSLNVFVPVQPSSRATFGDWMGRGRSGPGKHLLKNVSGVALPGEMLAILGASGAGKTTLLDALTLRSNRSLTVTGTRSLSGAIITSSRHLAGVAAYVQQVDLFVGWLTVREHLIFQALLRMDRRIPRSHRLRRVREVIDELGLTKCQNSIIGVPGKIKGLSGGEMKRLSFASEVLTDPALLLCDEPTSGLDSYMAQTTVEVLSKLARRGKTVVLTIHQPSSEVYSLFDKVLLMAEGRVAFLGAPTEAALFFSGIGAPCPFKYNPADFYVQLLALVPTEESSCRERIDRVCDAFERSEFAAKCRAYIDFPVKSWSSLKYGESRGLWFMPDVQAGRYKASWCAQFSALLWRSWLSVRKEPLLVRVRVLQTIMVSLLVAILYFGQSLNQRGVTNLNGAIFTTLSNITFQNVMAVIKVFCSERAVFRREHMAAMYRVDAYFLARTIAELPIFLLLPFIYTIIMYFAVGLNPDPLRFFTCIAVNCLIGLVATSFGYMISCAASSFSIALAVGMPSVIPLLLYGGFYVNLDTIPAYFNWIQYLSWFRYGNEALLVNQWEGVDNISCEDAFSNATCVRSGHVALQMYSFEEGTIWRDMGHLTLLAISFRAVALVLLIFKTTKSI